MAHEVLFAHSNNGFIRQLRTFLLNYPRVNRANDHDDINNLGIAYTLGGGGARPAGDILHVATQAATTPLTTHRATCVVGTASSGAFQTNINATVDWNIGARTIIATDSTDWVTAGVVVGDLIRITNAATAGNNRFFRVLSITTTSTTNDTITLNTLDVVAASDLGDVIDVRPATGGSVFDVREDQPSGNTFIGWMMSEIEFPSNDASLWLFMRDGGAWVATDFAEFTLEGGVFTLFDENVVSRTVDLNENGGSADTISRSDYNGNFLRDGFETGEQVEISGSVGEDGVFPIVTAAAKLLTLNIGDFTGDELDVDVQLTPRHTVTVDFDDADATFGGDPTIIRSAGSWLERGYQPGGQIEISDAVDGGNNSTFLIASIDTDATTNDTLVLDSAEVIADETADTITATPRNGILQAWTEHRYEAPVGTDISTGQFPPVPDGDGNYQSEWVAIGPGDDPVNNPETVYCGWQSQFSGVNLQNIEMRVFDAVSDSAFNSLGNTSPPTYMYMTNSPSMEMFMTADGAHVCGFVDVNTSVTEWFYQGFGRVHGTQNQHPRPMFNGGAGYSSTLNRSSSGDRLRFFPKGIDRTGVSDITAEKVEASCWHRWVDGQYFAVAVYHESTSTVIFASTALNVEMHTWPYGTQGNITFPFDGGLEDFVGGAGANGVNTDNPNSRATFPAACRPTPTTITPGAENRIYPLLPLVALLVNPAYNVVADFRNIFYIPGSAQATKNRVIQGGFTYIIGQNHEKTGQEDFAALRLA